MVRGDWGYSPLGVSVAEEIGTRMWVSLRLLLIGTLAGIVLGVALGAWTATRQYRVSDRMITAISLSVSYTHLRSVASEVARDERNAAASNSREVDQVWADVEQKLDVERVRKGLASLTVIQREAISLAYFGGCLLYTSPQR